MTLKIIYRNDRTRWIDNVEDVMGPAQEGGAVKYARAGAEEWETIEMDGVEVVKLFIPGIGIDAGFVNPEAFKQKAIK